MVFVLLAFLIAPAATLSQAERLYEQARYADALQALGESCQTATSPASCERLRAFVLAALGREEEARAAFARMLDAEPTMAIGDDVAPKLRALFEDAKRERRGSQLKLDSVEAVSEGGTWIIKLAPPAGVELKSVTAHIAAAGSSTFQAVGLTPENDQWVGSFKPSSGGLGAARYFLTATTKNGAAINSGSSALPKEVTVSIASRAVPDENGALGGGGDDMPTARVSDDRALLPNWAWWGIGGAALVIAAGVTTFFLLNSGDPEPGTLVIGIRFEDE